MFGDLKSSFDLHETCLGESSSLDVLHRLEVYISTIVYITKSGAMYHQHGDSSYAEFSSGHSHGGADPQGSTPRYMYGPYYGPKAPDGSPYMNPPGGGMQAFGSKPHTVALPDPTYASRWNAPAFVRGAGFKPGSDYAYPSQVGTQSTIAKTTDIGMVRFN